MAKKSIVLFCLMLPVVWPATASAQLLSHYTFDEASDQAIDSSGKGNHGVFGPANEAFPGGESNWVPGFLGQGLAFDDNLAIELPASAMGLRSDTGAVAFWFLMNGPPEGINTIWWGGDNNTGGGFGPENEMHIHVESFVPNIWDGGELAFHGQNTPANFHLFSDPNKGDVPGVEPAARYWWVMAPGVMLSAPGAMRTAM